MKDDQNLEWIDTELNRLNHDLENAISIADEELLEQEIEKLKNMRDSIEESIS
jgi:oligoribonuclease (3'-5' exoribonuclease)